jgi:regulator of sigma E protease
MAFSLLHILFAILGLGFLIFIHELGHYWVAIKKGMKVEAFSIGFGTALFKWERKGVRWQIGWLPFGGYVKVAGMQKEGSKEPSQVEGGFYSKSPWARMQMALAGPMVNLLFAFFLFCVLWALGGREKPFAETTHRIGWVDSQSMLYQKGIRPGDEIVRYNGKPFGGLKDLQIASMMDQKEIRIQGYKIDELKGEKVPFDETLPTYDDPRYFRDKVHTIGVVSPASYILYQGSSGTKGSFNDLQVGDRLLWADGELLFSLPQLSSIVNEQTAFLTVQRGLDVFHTKVARVPLSELKLSFPEKGEIGDWQHDAHLKGRLQDLFMIPYTLSPDCKVESTLPFIDNQDATRASQYCTRCPSFTPLEEGDRILAVDGEPVSSPSQFLKEVQTHRVLLITQRSPALKALVPSQKADAEFSQFDRSSLEGMISSIGTDAPIFAVGDLRRIESATPKPAADFAPAAALAASKKAIEGIKDSKLRSIAMKEFEASQKKQVLGIRLSDREVQVNPNPFRQFGAVFGDTARTLTGLFSGTLSPKHMSGPVGIIYAVQQSWHDGIKDVIYWMAVISLSLGFLNLLPIPVLDGGYILFSLWEIITKKPIHAKTLERLVIPFIGLMIALFLFTTYQDVSKLFRMFF